NQQMIGFPRVDAIPRLQLVFCHAFYLVLFDRATTTVLQIDTVGGVEQSASSYRYMSHVFQFDPRHVDQTASPRMLDLEALNGYLIGSNDKNLIFLLSVKNGIVLADQGDGFAYLDIMFVIKTFSDHDCIPGFRLVEGCLKADSR